MKMVASRTFMLAMAVILLLWLIFLRVGIRAVLVQPFSIPGGSMRPTLLEGDYLFAAKWAYGYSRHSLPFSPNLFSGRIWGSDPERGDVAVFKFPPDPSVDYIKRIIGLPGDRIRMESGVLIINDVPVPRQLTGQINNPDITEVEGPVDVYRETLPNGVSYDTLDLNPDAPGDNTREFVVPPGHFFAMGDNRDNSSDSRFSVGFVPAENLVGRAWRIFYSVNTTAYPEQIRAERLFKTIN